MIYVYHSLVKHFLHVGVLKDEVENSLYSNGYSLRATRYQFSGCRTMDGKSSTVRPDIVILPELWTTGYDLTRLNEIADQEAEKTIEFF
ncbi:hypothetical protein QFZ73_004638 [Peribacillus sp. V2I11]|nr:hypothetical protein [Peribacillus sp. V2I11]